MRTLVWFRNDLRVADNPALHEACREADEGVAAVFAFCPEQWRDEHHWGPPKAEFVRRCVAVLSERLAKLNIPLRIVEAGKFHTAADRVVALAGQLGCAAVHANREYEVNERRRDDRLRRKLRKRGIELREHHDQAVIPPGELRTGQGHFYSVFTPFKKAWLEAVRRDERLLRPRPTPRKRRASFTEPDAVPQRVPRIAAPSIDAALWPGGEREAQRRLRAFAKQPIARYASQRDQPAAEGTSLLSPYLACGAISPRQCLEAAAEANGGRLDGRPTGAAIWISQIIWRDFFRHVLVGFPRVSMDRPFKRWTERVPWRYDERDFTAWRDGRTGFPLVDAAMAQLNATGWMHNRLRMLVAMFLAKDLLIDWRRGERYFMHALVDGDLANNNGGWQWAASTGTDAAPYFRLFNPVTQSKRFDPDGRFIRRWLPPLADLEPRFVHEPWKLPDARRKQIGYPPPMVDHNAARQRALQVFRTAQAAAKRGELTSPGYV